MDENTVVTNEAINSLFTENPNKLNRIKHEMRVMAEETRDPLLDMIYQLLEFAETGRPIGDWKAAESALRNFKRNY